MPQEKAEDNTIFERPRAIWRQDLADAVKILWDYLIDRKGQNPAAYVTQERIGLDLHWEDGKVLRIVRECKALNILTTLRQAPPWMDARAGCRRRAINAYQVADPLVWTAEHGRLPNDQVQQVLYEWPAKSDRSADPSPVESDRSPERSPAKSDGSDLSNLKGHNKEERPIERPRNNNHPPSCALVVSPEREATPSSARARRRRRRRRRQQGEAAAPASPSPAAGRPDRLAERLRAFQAAYRAAMGFAYPLLADRDVPALQDLLAWGYSDGEIDAATQAMLRDKFFRGKRGGGNVALLLEHFGELLGKAQQAGLVPAGSPAVRRGVSPEDAVLLTVNGIVQRCPRVLPPHEQTVLLGLARKYLGRAYRLDGQGLAREWARKLCDLVVRRVADDSRDPLLAAGADMDEWVKDQPAAAQPKQAAM